MCSEPILPDAFSDLDVGITLHDPETGAVLDVNPALEDLYGYTAATLRTMRVEDYTAPSAKYTQEEAEERIAAAAAGTPQTFEWQIERPNGERRWVHVHLNATAIDGRPYVIAEINDVTTYKAREQRLQLLSRIVRHNLRNEMNVLMGHAETIERANEDDTLEATAATVYDIAVDVGSLSESITQLEEIATPDATERTPTDLTLAMDSIVDELGADYPAADIHVRAPEPVWIVADRGLEYALSHAIENAIVHAETDRPVVEITVAERADAGVVDVADEGPRIPDDEIDVLAPETTTNATFHGSGVGLYIMHWCVESHGGALHFSANEPRGNVVTFELPLVRNDEATDRADAPSGS